MNRSVPPDRPTLPLPAPGDYVSAALMGTRPDPLVSDLAPIYHLLAFWLMLYCPGDLFFRRVYASPLINAAVNVLATTACVQAMCHTTDTASKVYSGTALAPVLVGTLMGCAGKYAAHAVCVLGLDAVPRPGQPEHHTPEMSAPSFATRGALLTSGLYALTVWTRLLPPAAAEGLMLLANNVHCLVSEGGAVAHAHRSPPLTAVSAELDTQLRHFLLSVRSAGAGRGALPGLGAFYLHVRALLSLHPHSPLFCAPAVLLRPPSSSAGQRLFRPGLRRLLHPLPRHPLRAGHPHP